MSKNAWLVLLAACGSAPCPSVPVATTTGVEAPPPETPADARVVVLDGTPEVPPELHARLQQYLETRSAYADSIAADGSKLLVRTRFANTLQVHEVASAMGDRRQLTFGAEPIASTAYYPGDPSALLY